MIEYDLPKQYNQQLTINAYGVTFDFTLRYFSGMEYCTILTEDGETVVANLRCTDRQWLIPWKRFTENGNFRFEDDEYQYPDCTRFGKHCVLKFYTAEEIEAM